MSTDFGICVLPVDPATGESFHVQVPTPRAERRLCLQHANSHSINHSRVTCSQRTGRSISGSPSMAFKVRQNGLTAAGGSRRTSSRYREISTS